jgi:hypothetical protein
MTLVPVTASLSMIAKLESESPESARMLLMHGLYESLQDQIEAARPWLEPLLLVEVAKINLAAREGLVRYSVSKALTDGELVGSQHAAYLEMVNDYVVAKLDLFGAAKDRWGKLHPRGADGRFVRVGSFSPTGPNREITQNDSHRSVKAKVKEMKEKKAIKSDTPLILHLRSVDASGAMYAPELEAQHEIRTSPDHLEADLKRMNPDLAVTGVSVQRKHMTRMSPKEQAALDIGGMLTGRDFNANRDMMGRLDQAGFTGHQDNNARDWNAPSAGGPEQDRQAYRRMQLTGQALSAVSTPGSLSSVAGGAIQLAGSIGPEAEKVLGPGIRRAAYRYRGTERRPDPKLTANVKTAVRVAEGKADTERASENGTYAAGSYWNDPRYSHDQREMGAIGDTVAARMLGVDGQKPMIPDPELAEVSRASGEVPPSQGVIVDADGDLVSQAVGFNGDHYLPFDLRNLGELNGGQYIRTRTLGGPTAEDIYTGLMTGTRQLQVVSNSGVFTLEFDPDLRGGRRFSDKARRMVSRYEEILTAINDEGSELFERDVSPARKTELRVQASEASNSQAEFKDTFNRLLERERMRGTQVTEDDEEATLKEATANAEGRIREEYAEVRRADMPSPQGMARIREDMIAEEMDKLNAGGVRRLQLNGAGYDKAMKALQQEFPYFIRRAEWESLPDWHRTRGMRNRNSFSRVGAKDSGHVKPGQTNPAIGLQGANERRKVGVMGARTREAEEPQATTQRSDAAAATGSVAPLPGAKKKVTRTELLSESSKFRIELDRAADRLVDAATGVDPQGGALAADANPDGEPAGVQLNYWASRAKEKGGKGREGRAFVNWLLNEAPQHRREDAMRGLKALPALVGRAPDYDPEAAALVEPAYNRLTEMLDLLEPYADAKGTEPHLVEPNVAVPKPPKFAGMPDVFDDEETLKLARNKLVANEEDTGKAMAKLEKLDDAGRAEHVLGLHQNYAGGPDMGEDKKKERLRKLTAAQRAWSMLHTQEKAEQLRAYLPGDADPKVGKADRSHRAVRAPVTLSKSSTLSRPQRVIVHKVDDPFSRRTRALLGIPEPSNA